MCIPAALAFWANLAINCSTFLPTTIIKSANSSTAITIKGNSSKFGISSSVIPFSGSILKVGSLIGCPDSFAFFTFALKPFKFLTDKAAINLYLLSISFTHHLSPKAA